MAFDDQSRYTRTFHQVVHKGGESEINYIKIFRNAKSLTISVVNDYSKDQLMHTFLENFQKSINYSDQIEIHQVELRRE